MEKITFIIWGVITLFQLHVVYKIAKLNKIVEEELNNYIEKNTRV